MNVSPLSEARAIVQRGIDERVFPAAVVEIGDADGVLWTEAFGRLMFDDGVDATTATVFDLASLTKPIATTSLVLGAFDHRRMRLTDPLVQYLAAWRGADREPVTIQDLLEHASGLPARLFDAPPSTRTEFEHDICVMPLEYEPRTRSIYSDLDFILLGFVIADVGGDGLAPLFASMWSGVARAIGGESAGDYLGYGVPAALHDRTAPTRPLAEDARRGRILVGEVHDNYAAALGGAAGHAGLFGTAPAVGRFARAVLGSARGNTAIPSPLSTKLVARATTKTVVSGSSRALGWDTMLPTSSCGSEMSPAAFGHVGYTGTSLWIDPVLDRYFVVLTNRVAGTGTSEAMQGVRRAFHDAAARI